ncbi:hypothetical protein MC885_005274, partial [Smutsia gigantea]
MAYCRQEGKDRIIFVTKEDHETPSNAELVADDPNDPYEEHGNMGPSGAHRHVLRELSHLLPATAGFPGIHLSRGLAVRCAGHA